MFVLKKTMNIELEKERKKTKEFYQKFGNALNQVIALQKQLSAWIFKEPGLITPQQMAQVFYSHDDYWQADFFNSLQEEIRNYHVSKPEGEFGYAGIPAGEPQWYHMTKHLSDEGLETLKSMYDHAIYHRKELTEE